MNKLIIIGNGFERAHGLASDYYSFMFDLLNKAFHEVAGNTNGVLDNPLFVLRRTSSPISGLRIDSPEFFKVHLVNIKNAPLYPSSGVKYFTLYPKTDFIQHLIATSCDYRWVDIENIFYNYLKKSYDDKWEVEKVRLLNEQLEFIKVKLKDYLLNLEPARRLDDYSHIFRATPRIGIGEEYLADTAILNFNYTDTATMYKGDAKLIHIHGHYRDIANPLIFGFGDELDSHYEIFKHDEIFGFSTHLKSFLYSKAESFPILDDFLGIPNHPLKGFEAVILGHSCGRSDRALLNYIFEHPNCRSIRVYYYERDGKDNFKEVNDNLARQFNSTRWYKKMVPFTRLERMPQHDD